MNGISLLHGDCLELMKEIPDGSIDMVLCDLPYGRTRNKWDVVIPFDQLWKQYRRIVKLNGAIVLFADGMFMAELMVSNPSMWRYNLVWDKVLTGGFLNANKMPLRQHEELCVFYKKPPTYNPQKTKGTKSHSKGSKQDYANNNYGSYNIVDNADLHGDLKFPTSILRYQKPHPSKALHPTEKPVSLCENIIKTYTNPGETVLDNCMGSGTTGVACVNTGRLFVGMENNLDTFITAVNRIEEATAAHHHKEEILC